MLASSLVAWLLWGGPPPAYAQSRQLPASQRAPVAQASRAPAPGGVLEGRVLDEHGVPLTDVIVTAIGVGTAFALTDDQGRFELGKLAPGKYLVRAIARGYAPHSQRVTIDAQARAASVLALKRTGSLSVPVILTAGFGALGVPEPVKPHMPGAPNGPLVHAVAPDSENLEDEEPRTEASENSTPTVSEMAWRLRHARRGVLKSAVVPFDLDEIGETERATVIDVVGKAMRSPARAASSFLADTPFSGQVNFLTTSLFQSPAEMLTATNIGRGIAYVKLGAPVGDTADWTVRGALTEADLASWVVSGTYQTRASERRHYQVGLAYSTQTYGGGHPLALREVTDGSRNVGTLFGFDTVTVAPALSLTYGGRFAHYDYLASRTLVSPMVSASFTPAERTRVSVTLSSRGDAPGADEFLPPSADGIWLPPQRTFSSADPGAPFRSARTDQIAGEVERDLGWSTVTVRAFRQQVENQLATVFGAEPPDYREMNLGHYFVGTAGNSQATGGSVALRSTFAGRVRGSLSYSLISAELFAHPTNRQVVLLAPTLGRPALERLHDISTFIDAVVPETSTKVLVTYRVGNGYARPVTSGSPGEGAATRVDSRFDVQVRQALPFLNFTSTRWEMLLAVRNFLRDAEFDQSVYDELLAVRPPKRVVGGVTLHF